MRKKKMEGGSQKAYTHNIQVLACVKIMIAL